MCLTRFDPVLVATVAAEEEEVEVVATAILSMTRKLSIWKMPRPEIIACDELAVITMIVL